jgi:hypothetical protein
MVRCHNHVLQHARGGDPNQHRGELATCSRFGRLVPLIKERKSNVASLIGLESTNELRSRSLISA